MSDKKTHADIVANMRWQAKQPVLESCGEVIHPVDENDVLEFAKELEAAHKHEVEALNAEIQNLKAELHRAQERIEKEFAGKLPKPDPNWKEICAKCFENGATEPPDCKYYSEDGCMSPIPDQHPLIQVVNMEKLREAVVHMIDTADSIAMREPTGAIGKLAFHIKHTGDAALAAPARNCDVGTLDEQRARLKAFCDSHGHGFDGQKNYSCENCPFIDDKECELAWANQPISKEGGFA